MSAKTDTIDTQTSQEFPTMKWAYPKIMGMELNKMHLEQYTEHADKYYAYCIYEAGFILAHLLVLKHLPIAFTAYNSADLGLSFYRYAKKLKKHHAIKSTHHLDSHTRSLDYAMVLLGGTVLEGLLKDNVATELGINDIKKARKIAKKAYTVEQNLSIGTYALEPLEPHEQANMALIGFDTALKTAFEARYTFICGLLRVLIKHSFFDGHPASVDEQRAQACERLYLEVEKYAIANIDELSLISLSVKDFHTPVFQQDYLNYFAEKVATTTP